MQAVIDYFRDYPDRSHHPKEEVLFAKLKARDPAAAASEVEHRNGARRLRLVARAVESVLSEQEVLRQTVHDIVRNFIEKERRAHADGGARSISRRGSGVAARRLGADRCEIVQRSVARLSERREVQFTAGAHSAMGGGKHIRHAEPLRILKKGIGCTGRGRICQGWGTL